MISVEEAQQRILDSVTPMASEQISLIESAGRVLAQDVIARRTQPPMAVSAMDGYAVRAVDVGTVPASLKVIGEAPAGAAFAGTVGQGEAVRIFTGGPVPDGADTIVIQENVDAQGQTIKVNEGAKEGRFIRAKGLDFQEGDVGLENGRALSARDVALAAAMNYPWLRVKRQPRVAILATGDEIVMPGEPIGADQIVSSNELAVAAAVRCFGGEPILLGVAPDERDALGALVDGARGADVLVTSGGVSVGERDLVQDVLRDRGMDLDFWKIAMRPGKPLMFGKLGQSTVIGLPGNPVSAMVCTMIFLRPALLAMLGLDPHRNAREAKLASPLAANDRRQDYLRGILTDTDTTGLTVSPFPKQDSSMLSLLQKADCLIERAPFADGASVGDEVKIHPFPTGLLAF